MCWPRLKGCGLLPAVACFTYHLRQTRPNTASSVRNCLERRMCVCVCVCRCEVFAYFLHVGWSNLRQTKGRVGHSFSCETSTFDVQQRSSGKWRRKIKHTKTQSPNVQCVLSSEGWTTLGKGVFFVRSFVRLERVENNLFAEIYHKT